MYDLKSGTRKETDQVENFSDRVINESEIVLEKMDQLCEYPVLSLRRFTRLDTEQVTHNQIMLIYSTLEYKNIIVTKANIVE